MASFLGTLEERQLLAGREGSQSLREQALADLAKLPDPDPTLLQCIPHGVAFHHAGELHHRCPARFLKLTWIILSVCGTRHLDFAFFGLNIVDSLICFATHSWDRLLP